MRALYSRSVAVSRIKLKHTYFLNFVLFKVINSSCLEMSSILISECCKVYRPLRKFFVRALILKSRPQEEGGAVNASVSRRLRERS